MTNSKPDITFDSIFQIYEAKMDSKGYDGGFLDDELVDLNAKQLLDLYRHGDTAEIGRLVGEKIKNAAVKSVGEDS